MLLPEYRNCRCIALTMSLGVSAACARFLDAQVLTGAPESRHEVYGSVTDSATGRPVTDVEISLRNVGVRTRSDAAGHYRIAGFLPATVFLQARKVGYAAYTVRIVMNTEPNRRDVVMISRAEQLQTVRIAEDTVARFLATQQPTSAMSADVVREKRGQTLGETLKELPGVAIIQYGPSIAKPVVRGLSSQRIATVNGGVPQEGQQWGGEHAPEIDAFAANEIEVIRGPGTILYGSGALGGVVRVIPKPLPTLGVFDGEVSTNGFLNNRQGALSLLAEGAALPVPIVGDIGWRLQATGRQAGDARTPTYYLPNSGFKELDIDGVLGLSRNWGHSELTLSHFGTNLGLYVGAHVGNLDDLTRAMQSAITSPTFSYALGTPNQSVVHDEIISHSSIDLSDGSNVEVSYGFQHNNRREFDNHGFAAGGKRPAFALELFTHSLDVLYHQRRRDRLNGTVGMSAVRQGNLSPGRSFLIPQYRLYSGGVFALETADVSRLTISAGGRVDSRYQHAYQYGEPVIVSPDDKSSYSGTSGSLGVTAHVSETWSAASTVTFAWRPPNVNERFSQGVHHGTAQYEIGDSSLGPETSHNIDVTVRHQGVRTRVEASVFANRIDDYIFLQPRDPIATVRGAYPAYNYASTNALLRGTELTAQFAPAHFIELYANGNLLRGVNRADNTPLYDMPADRVTTSARFMRPSNSSVILPFVEVAGTLVRKQDQVPLVTVYKLPTNAYALLNIEVGANTLRLGHVSLKPTLTIRNALDTQYRDYLSRYRLFVNDVGRDIVLRITAPFGASR